MKPKELLNNYIENQLVSELQKLGFRYFKGGPKFSRTKGYFELTFNFSLSKWNSEDYCEFWTMWGVTSKEYAKWYKEQWESKPENNAIVGDAEWNVPGWSRDVVNHFTLTNSESDKAVFDELKYNVLDVAIPYYSKISDWNTAAEYASSKERIVFYDKVCDFYLLAGEKEKAKEILELGIREIEERKHDQLMLLPKIQMRLDKYFK
jgi:hypothetical protein